LGEDEAETDNRERETKRAGCVVCVWRSVAGAGARAQGSAGQGRGKVKLNRTRTCAPAKIIFIMVFLQRFLGAHCVGSFEQSSPIVM
jgi:hypothetical protein